MIRINAKNILGSKWHNEGSRMNPNTQYNASFDLRVPKGFNKM